jgi:hypothetical protein
MQTGQVAVTDPSVVPGPRLAALGDIGGWLAPLWEALQELGIDPDTLALPDDTVVVQVGDLIHKGPDSKEVVALVDRIMAANPGRWRQLVGNHEAQHLGGPEFWDCDCSPALIRTLRSWWDSGQATLAVAARLHAPITIGTQGDAVISLPGTDAGQEVLLLHGGITPGYLHDLGPTPPQSAAATADAITHQARRDPARAFAAGRMLADTRRDAVPGPCWAEPVGEVCGAWHDFATFGGQQLPWHLVHGHAMTYRWSRARPDPRLPRELRRQALAAARSRHSAIPVAGQWVIGIDPGFTTRGAGVLRPASLHAEIVGSDD